MISLFGDRATRRRHRDLRRRIKAAASARDGAELIRLYESPDCDEAGVRIDALRALAGADPAAAQPVLRQAIEGPEDAWVTVFALDLVQEWRLVELRARAHGRGRSASGRRQPGRIRRKAPRQAGLI